MKPTTQLVLHDPDKGLWGDCQRAVIASLLELPIEAIPNFGELGKENADTFYHEIQKFLLPLGYQWMSFKAMDITQLMLNSATPVYHEIAGPSPRFPDVYHATVGLNGQIVFDPHPDRTGLVGDPTEWTYSFLVRINT